MKDTILERAGRGSSGIEKLNFLREELHHLILQEIDRKGGFNDLCFQGGTALRLLFGLDRFSEDLDFCLSSDAGKNFELKLLVRSVLRSLEGFGFECHIAEEKSTKAVHSSFFFRFSGLLAKVDPFFGKDRKLAIKVEVDTHPPGGGREVISPVSGAHLYKVRHHDLPSLFAGKLHAILCRRFTKGRDLYDFLWYTGRRTPVNLVLLNNAVKQTEEEPVPYTEKTLRKALRERFEKIDFGAAKKDVESFVGNRESLRLFDRAVFSGAVEGILVEQPETKPY